MPSSITWEQLRELAAFRAERGCAVSLYMGLDPSIVPTAGDLASHTRSMLARAERQVDEQRTRLSHAERKALAGDLERIASWFESEFSREGVRGVAVFAAALDGLFRPLSLAWPVADDARIAQQLYLAPLVRGVGRGDGAVVAYVGRERGDVYRLRGGQLTPLVDETADVPGRHDQGGWSQARYERHIETIVDRHLREVADALDRCVRGLRGARVVLVGPMRIVAVAGSEEEPGNTRTHEMPQIGCSSRRPRLDLPSRDAPRCRHDDGFDAERDMIEDPATFDRATVALNFDGGNVEIRCLGGRA